MLLTDRAISICAYALFVLAEENVGLTGPRTDMEEIMLFELEEFLALIPDASSKELEMLKKASVYELKNGIYLIDVQRAQNFVNKLSKLFEHINVFEEVYKFFEEVLKEAGSPVLLSDVRVMHGS